MNELGRAETGEVRQDKLPRYAVQEFPVQAVQPKFPNRILLAGCVTVPIYGSWAGSHRCGSLCINGSCFSLIFLFVYLHVHSAASNVLLAASAALLISFLYFLNSTPSSMLGSCRWLELS